MTTIGEVEKGSNNQCKAIVVFTSNHAYHIQGYTWEQLTDTVLAHGYKVYAFLPWTGDDQNPQEDSLITICHRTRGEAFITLTAAGDTTFATLKKYMQAIYDLIDQQDKYCTVSFDSRAGMGHCEASAWRLANAGPGCRNAHVRGTVRFYIFHSIIVRMGSLTTPGGQAIDLDLSINPPYMEYSTHAVSASRTIHFAAPIED